MTLAAHDPTVHSAYRFGALALLLAAGSILGALAFEHLGGLAPCELCLQQRYAYYLGVPLLFLALVGLSAGQPRAAGDRLRHRRPGVPRQRRARRLPRGRRMAVLGGAGCVHRLASADQQRRQYARSVATDERRALRPGGVATRRAVAGRVECCGFAARCVAQHPRDDGSAARALNTSRRAPLAKVIHRTIAYQCGRLPFSNCQAKYRGSDTAPPFRGQKVTV